MIKFQKVIIVIVTVYVVYLVVNFFTPIDTGQGNLTEKQRENLCTEINREYDLAKEEYKDFEGTAQTAIKIFGVEADDDIRTVYGYFGSSYYIKVKDRSYEVEGGAGLFMYDLKVRGDSVRIIKDYGFCDSDQATYEKMPFRYQIKSRFYNPDGLDGENKQGKAANKKAEKVLGVPVETKYHIDIEDGKYEIWDLDENDDEIIKEKGNVSDIQKKN